MILEQELATHTGKPPPPLLPPWCELKFHPRPTCVFSCSVMSDSMDCSLPGPSVHGKNNGVGCHFLLQGIFPSQESNLCLLQLLHWQVEPLSLLRSPLYPGPKDPCTILYSSTSSHLRFFVCFSTEGFDLISLIPGTWEFPSFLPQSLATHLEFC